jgi:hypothetical protein
VRTHAQLRFLDFFFLLFICGFSVLVLLFYCWMMGFCKFYSPFLSNCGGLCLYWIIFCWDDRELGPINLWLPISSICRHSSVHLFCEGKTTFGVLGPELLRS